MWPRRTITALSMLTALCWTAPAGGQRFLERLGQPGATRVGGASPTVVSGFSGGQRAYLGIVGDDSRGPGSGASVLSVQSGGPADVAGILPGDVITAVAGIPVRNLEQLARKIQDVGPGQRIMVRVQRRGRPMDVTVQLAGRGPATNVDSRREPANRASREQLEELPAPAPRAGVPPRLQAGQAADLPPRPSATSAPAVAPLPAPPPAMPSPAAADKRAPTPERGGGPIDDAAGTRGVTPRSAGGREVEDLKRQIDSMHREIARLRQQLAEMKARLEAVERVR